MRLAFALTLVALAGCAVTTGVVAIGDDTWSVTHRDKGPLGSLGELRATAYREAASFCSAKGKAVQIMRNNDTPRSQGQPPETEIQFSCVERPR